ncbi:MAG: hypothetical protein RIT27_1798 [Pseudomonadota bacterium]|jgi:sulfur-oxidizing protein SoxZ
MSGMRVQAKKEGDVIEVKILVSHPMETGTRKDQKTNEVVPAHFIQELTCEHAGKVVLSSDWSGGISKNPYLSFKFKSNEGGSVKVTWKDNKGETETQEAVIK